MKYEELDALLEELAREQEQEPLPESFQTGWREAVREEARGKKRTAFVRGLSALAAVLVIAVGIGALTRTSQSPMHLTDASPAGYSRRMEASAQPQADSAPLTVAAAEPLTEPEKEATWPVWAGAGVTAAAAAGFFLYKRRKNK